MGAATGQASSRAGGGSGSRAAGGGAAEPEPAPPSSRGSGRGWRAFNWVAMPLLTLVAVLGLAVVAVEVSDDAQRDAARATLDARTGVISGLIADHVEALQATASERAGDLLTGAVVDPEQLRSVVVGMGFTTGAVFDADGRLLVGLSGRPELVGQPFADRLEHLRVALTEGRPVASQAIVSPALQVPTVALAVPYPTPQGRRVLGLVGTLESDVLHDLLDRAAGLERLELTVVDREGRIVASTREGFARELVDLADWDPALDEALARARSGELVRPDGTARVYASSPVGRTGWDVAVQVAPARLFAAVDGAQRTAWGSVWVLGVLGLGVVLVVAGLRRRRDVAEWEVHRLNGTLQQRVVERTAELETANEELAGALRAAEYGERVALRLAAVAQAAGEALIGEDVDGIITNWNPAAEHLYGYTAQEAIGRHMTMLARPGTEVEAVALLDRALAGETVVGVEAVRCRRDGRCMPVSITKAPVRGPDGRIVGAVGIHRDLSEQRAAEAAEREARAMFASVFHDGAAPQGVTDMTGRFVQVNRAMCDMLGYAADELTSMTVGEIIGAEDRQMARGLMQEFRDGSLSSIQRTQNYVHRDGHPVVTVTTLNAVAGDDGAPRWVVGMLQDITEQSRAYRQLAAREAMLEAVTASVDNITLLYDSEGRCVFAAGAGLAALGVDRDDLVGTHLTDVHGPGDRTLDAFTRALRGEEVDEVLDVAGRSFDVRVRAVRHDGRITHVAAAVVDITERHRHQEVVAQSERRLSALVAHARDAIALVSLEGMITYVSPGIRQIVGLPAETVTGMHFADLVPRDDLEAAVLHLDEVIAGTAETSRLRVRHADGSVRDVECHGTNLLDDPAVGALVMTVRDVTDGVVAARAEDEHAAQLQALNDELVAAVQVRDHILDATTHELRTPLTPALGMLEVLRQRWDDVADDNRLHYFEVIERNLGRIATLVEDLLFASRIRAGTIPADPEPLDLTDHVTRALAKWPEIGDVNVRTDRPVRAWCQPDHLEQILNSLLSNAVTYGAPPYQIDISTTPDAVVIAVDDQGPGVPEHIRHRMFQPFVQGSTGDQRTAHGLGLGLHIAHTLARANGGDLTHEGYAGSSRFVLTLEPVEIGDPRVPETAAARPTELEAR